MFDSLRDFIDRVQEMRDCKVIEGADWDLEIGALTEWGASVPDSPMLLFDKIKGYKQGYRVASNLFTSERRTALALELPTEARGIELVDALRKKLAEGVKLMPPVEVGYGPVKENVLIGDEVNLLDFPAPKWHELDGGRYIGTGSMTITRDRDEGWVNLGVYRHQIIDKITLGTYIVPGHHGNIMRQKYWDRGEPCPTAVVCGQDPMLWAAASQVLNWGVSEYDYAGAFRGAPIEVIRGITTDLPVPATAEIVIEGDMLPPEVETRLEGPFGESHGHYCSAAVDRPILKVKSIMHRNTPIIQGNPPMLSLSAFSLGAHLYRAAGLWNELDRQLPGVAGTWYIQEMASRGGVVISLRQQYPGHAKQAALVAAGCLPTAYGLKYIIVVDDDIDPSNISEVLWAIGSRSDPAISIDIIGGCWGSSTNPMFTADQIRRDEIETGRGIIFACKPFQRLKDFPPICRFPPELMKKFKDKWNGLF